MSKKRTFMEKGKRHDKRNHRNRTKECREEKEGKGIRKCEARKRRKDKILN